jgi:hypothetical protein
VFLPNFSNIVYVRKYTSTQAQATWTLARSSDLDYEQKNGFFQLFVFCVCLYEHSPPIGLELNRKL